jgi:hypothetical protein
VLLPLSNAEQHGAFVSIMALNALDYMDERAMGAKEQIEGLPREDPKASPRFGEAMGKIIDRALADLR